MIKRSRGDYEDEEVTKVNAYIVEQLRGALATLEDHTNGKHHRLLLDAALLVSKPTIQAEYWPEQCPVALAPPRWLL